MKENDIKFFKIIAVIICLVLSLGVGVYIYNNNIEYQTLEEFNSDYAKQYGK